MNKRVNLSSPFKHLKNMSRNNEFGCDIVNSIILKRVKTRTTVIINQNNYFDETSVETMT